MVQPRQQTVNKKALQHGHQRLAWASRQLDGFGYSVPGLHWHFHTILHHQQYDLSTATVTSVGVTDTGLAGPGLNPAQTITVVGVSDSQNTITLSMNSSSPFPFQLTDSVIGYAANSILVAGGNSNLIADDFLLNDAGLAADIMGIISGAPISQGTSLTFTATGNTSGSTPPPPTPSGPSTPSGNVTVHGSHSQYVVASNNGSLYVQDTVVNRDGTQTLPNDGTITFTDGTGVFDPTGTAENVARLYSATLGRAADDSGLAFWTSDVDNDHVPLSQVANTFSSSPEFISTYGSLSDSAFVQQLYQNVLHRPGDASGTQFWTGVLAAGSSRGQVAESFAEGPENRANTLSIAGDVNDAESYRLFQGPWAASPTRPARHSGPRRWRTAPPRHR
jgi:hypothetical protein